LVKIIYFKNLKKKEENNEKLSLEFYNKFITKLFFKQKLKEFIFYLKEMKNNDIQFNSTTFQIYLLYLIELKKYDKFFNVFLKSVFKKNIIFNQLEINFIFFFLFKKKLFLISFQFFSLLVHSNLSQFFNSYIFNVVISSVLFDIKNPDLLSQFINISKDLNLKFDNNFIIKIQKIFNSDQLNNLI
jgi:hypothetical protein